MATHTAASPDELAAALDALYQSGDFVFSRRVPPTGRRFQEGHMVNRRFGMETVAQACALRQLGCTITGIQKILGQLYTPKPAYPTVVGLLGGDIYEDIRTSPGFNGRLAHYLDFFKGAFDAMPGWRPSGAALKEAEAAAPKSRYKGTAGNAWAKAAATVVEDTTDHNTQRMAEAAERRAKARSVGQYPS